MSKPSQFNDDQHSHRPQSSFGREGSSQGPRGSLGPGKPDLVRTSRHRLARACWENKKPGSRTMGPSWLGCVAAVSNATNQCYIPAGLAAGAYRFDFYFDGDEFDEFHEVIEQWTSMSVKCQGRDFLLIRGSPGDQDHRFFPLAIRRFSQELSGALVCDMLCLTGSPPRTTFSVITYRTPGSGSNKTPSKTSSTTDLKLLAPVPRSKAILAISRTAPSVNIRSAPWNRTSFLNCWINDPFGV